MDFPRFLQAAPTPVALNFLGYYAAAIETALLLWLSVDKHGVADRAIHEHGLGFRFPALTAALY